MQIIERAKFAVTGEDAASNMEIIVWFAVVLGIAIFLFAFRDQVGAYLNKITGKVGNMTTEAGTIQVTTSGVTATSVVQ